MQLLGTVSVVAYSPWRITAGIVIFASGLGLTMTTTALTPALKIITISLYALLVLIFVPYLFLAILANWKKISILHFLQNVTLVIWQACCRPFRTLQTDNIITLHKAAKLPKATKTATPAEPVDVTKEKLV